jgi:outer membrane immunogenic protein
MKKLLIGAAALAGLSGTAALAADLPAGTYSKAPAYVPAVIYNWTGFYIGGHIGGDWRNSNVFNSNNGQFIAGVQGGADYQFAQSWVMGVEANYSFKTSNNNNGYAFVAPGGAGLVSNNSASNGLGSVTGRVGWTWGPGLLYVKGGYGFRDNGNSVAVTVAGAPVPFIYNRSQDGYTVGAGLEYMFTQNWSGKLEYQYFNFGNSQFVAGPVALVGLGSYHSNEQTFKAGINYRFNMVGPVVARY